MDRVERNGYRANGRKIHDGGSSGARRIDGLFVGYPIAGGCGQTIELLAVLLEERGKWR